MSWSGCIMMYESPINTVRPEGLIHTTLAANKSAREEKQRDQLNGRLRETRFIASGEAAGGRPVHNRDAPGPAVLRARPRGPCAPCILVTARPPRAPVENTCATEKRVDESGARAPLGAQRACAPGSDAVATQRRLDWMFTRSRTSLGLPGLHH